MVRRLAIAAVLLIAGAALLIAGLILVPPHKSALWLLGKIQALRRPPDFEFMLCGGRQPEAAYTACADPHPLLGFLNPPPVTVYARLIDAAGPDWAFRIHTLASLMLLGIALLLLLRLAEWTKPHAVFAALIGALMIAPVANSLYGGHLDMLLLAAFVIGAWAAVRGRPWLTGAAIAGGFWLELYPVLLVVLVAVQTHRRRIILVAAATTAAIPLLLIPWVPLSLYGDYFGEVLPALQRYTAPGHALSFAGVLTHMQAGARASQLYAIVMHPALRWASLVILALGILVAMLHQRAMRDTAPLETLALLLATFLIAAPLTSPHHYVLAVPLVFVTLRRVVERPSWEVPLVFACWAVLLVPSWLPLPAPLERFASVRALYYARYPLAIAAMAGLLMLARRMEWQALLTRRGGRP